ncbi:hypothetical protein KIPB_014648, partial [Kipferlia bialata]|eukprot:g14648.t1
MPTLNNQTFMDMRPERGSPATLPERGSPAELLGNKIIT